MTMVIRFELRIRDQIATSVRFDIKNGNPPLNAGTLKTIVCICRNTYTQWQSCRLGGSYLFMKYDGFRQNADFFKGMEMISFNCDLEVASLLYKHCSALLMLYTIN